MAETTTPRKGNGPSNAVMIAIVAVALMGMAVVNSLNTTLSPQEQERRQKEAEAKAAEEAMKKAQTGAGEAQALRRPVTGINNELVLYGPEKILGDPKGNVEITFAWEWTPDVQADPSKVLAAVEAIKARAPSAKIRLVNLDSLPQMEPGVYVNGEKRLPAQPDGSFIATAEAYGPLVPAGQAPTGQTPTAGASVAASPATAPAPNPSGSGSPAATTVATPNVR